MILLFGSDREYEANDTILKEGECQVLEGVVEIRTILNEIGRSDIRRTERNPDVQKRSFGAGKDKNESQNDNKLETLVAENNRSK